MPIIASIGQRAYNNQMKTLLIFILLISSFSIFATSTISEGGPDLSFKYIAFTYAHEVYSLSKKLSTKVNQKKLETLYNKIYNDGVLFYHYAIHGTKEICKTEKFKSICKKHFSVMNGDKFSKHYDSFTEEFDRVEKRLAYLDNSSDEYSRHLQLEGSYLAKHIFLKHLYKVGSDCPEELRIMCSLKVKDIVQDRIMGSFGLIKEQLDKVAEKRNIRAPASLPLKYINEAKAANMQEVKNQLVDSFRDIKAMILETSKVPFDQH